MGIIQTPEAFYVTAHQKIFQAILEMESDRKVIDLVTVAEYIRSKGEIDAVGGHYYLTGLSMNVVTSAHVEEHAYIVMEKYLARELIRISSRTTADAYTEETDIFDLIDSAESQLTDLTTRHIPGGFKSAQQLSRELHTEVVAAQAKGSDLSGLPSGYPEIDALIGGWKGKRLIVIGARPSVGKTALALNFAIRAARNKIGVGFFSLEMGDVEISKRIIAAMAEIDLYNLDTGKIDQFQQRYNQAQSEFSKMNLHVDESHHLTIPALRAKARKLVKLHGVKILLIDYLQLMSADGVYSKAIREQQVAYLSRELKKLSKELDVDIVAMSQLNRVSEARPGDKPKPPGLADLRESGAIEQDADIVMLLYGSRAGEFVTDDPMMVLDENRMERKLNIAKARNGTTGLINLYFNMPVQKFMSDQESPRIFDNPHAGIFNHSNKPPANYWNESD